MTAPAAAASETAPVRPRRRVFRPDVSIGALRVWQRNRDVFLRLWRSELAGMLVEPWIVIAAMGLGLGRFVELEGDRPYVAFIAPGLLAAFPMFAGVFECAWGSFLRLEIQHTYDAAIATPVSVDDVVTGDLFWGTTRSLINASYILLAFALLDPFLDTLRSPWALLVLPVSILPGLLFCSISMMFAGIARAMSQFAYFFNLLILPMFWFGGAFFPIDSLPDWAQTVAWFMPLSHVVDLYTGFLDGRLAWSMLGDLLWLSVVTVVCYSLALRLMRRRLIN